MATRGIYIFTSEVYGKINIYNHWDNYPDGAKKFFEAAVLLSKSESIAPNASFLDLFIKANLTTEIIGSQEEIPNYGQEFTYFLEEKNNQIFLEIEASYSDFAFKGTLEEFLNLKPEPETNKPIPY
jgi:hypothetical protein